MNTIAHPNKSLLSPEELALFHKQSYLGPYTLCSPEEMAGIRKEIDSMIQTDPQISPGLNRHLDVPFIYKLVTDPTIIDRIIPLIGPDLFLWRTGFFIKEPGSMENPWHQDGNFWTYIEPEVIVSVWIAIDETTIENGCLQIIPGAHHKAIPHIKAGESMILAEMADPRFVEEEKLVNLEMKPGEFILFNERTLHRSEPNRSDLPRTGMVARIIIPAVKVLEWDGLEHSLIRICGEDKVGQNRLTDPPA